MAFSVCNVLSPISLITSLLLVRVASWQLRVSSLDVPHHTTLFACLSTCWTILVLGKIKALAEAAAAKKQAKYERLMAEKEHDGRQCEEEEEQRRQQQHAQYDRDMAILVASKVEAMAKARLEAIEESIRQEDTV